MNIVALAGGVGGAKLADGLAQAVGTGDRLTVIVNTGDDFSFCGLKISPDLDTVCYTLAGLANAQTGWGRANESWTAFTSMGSLGGPSWFNLGDLDLGTHLERTRRILAGDSLSRITQDFCRAWAVPSAVLPMTDQVVATLMDTEEFGWLSFQEYFVRHGCQPTVKQIRFEGIEQARPAPGVLEAVLAADLVVVCPSNPFVSVAPILAIPGIKEAIQRKNKVVAVSPIVGGKALKGPAAKMFLEFGKQPSALAVAVEYKGWVHCLVIDAADAELAGSIEGLGMKAVVENTVMVERADRKMLAEKVIALGIEGGR